MHREGQIPLTLTDQHDRTSGTEIGSDSIALVNARRELQGKPATPWHWLPTVSRPLQLLFDFPSGLVVDDKGWAAADRVVKFHDSVGNRSRYAFIFPRTTHQVVVLIVEGREYVVAIFVGFNAATVEVIRLSHHAPVIEAANSHVMERTFSFDIACDSSFVMPAPLSIFATTLST
jgi:hypothetical protein